MDQNVLLAEVPFCAVDFETTQIRGKPGELAIIEIGAQRFTNGEAEDSPFESFVNPQCCIREFDSRVSGIYNEMVCQAPLFTNAKDRFFPYIEGRVLVAHNAAFDQRALRSQCIRDDIEEPVNVFLDSAKLLRRLVALPKYNLKSAAQHYGLKKRPTHRALDDCLVVVELFSTLIWEGHEKLGIRTLADLCEVLGVLLQKPPRQMSLF